ncbi:AAA family ATPase [Noviherbaspirillum sp.]|uniref:AAA family ATPase n=1 Tax=Noviherbaspirillum sp. TaxID=1926288 RepID=UPI002FE0444D
MPKVYLIEGPVGAGKSTYASALAQRTQGIHIALDDWFVALFSPDRPADHFVPSWYIERKARLLDLIWNHSRRILASGADAILELGLIQRQARSEFCSRVVEEGFDLQLHILDAPLDVRRERVRRRNTEKGATFAMVVPDHVFEMASTLWEAPDDAECSDYPVEFVEIAALRGQG